MKASIVSVIAALASFTTAFPTQKRDLPITFNLKPGPDAPPEISGLGLVQWENKPFGLIGWFPTNINAKGVEAFIQYNAQEGIAFDAKATSRTLYLTDDGVAKMWNPLLEDPPIAFREASFSTDTSPDGTKYFGYDNDYNGAWIACGGSGTYTLEFGHTSKPGCTDSFSLQVEYV